ncbi:S-adenosyl-L-methionine-dependent methyltransferase [Venustampulla echinocandica]|uniref:tRNA (uracil(54)-C(5))-methyltransferase n=1 Tax=Venustampulla echinocandica TaxID=2656787 RepID=A0A370TLV7_9HELO|nr:S-adenosyl-L-methionine-dependent methyltransferase [Venustampulla echinocandica]RDL36499.1 S-adenosyl-L-methionine-dependent methyltransferase [Venustampulla echinocandica]
MDAVQSKPKPQERKRENQGGRGAKRQRTRKEKPAKEGSNDEVLIADVRELFAAQKLADSDSDTPQIPTPESADAHTLDAEAKPTENGLTHIADTEPSEGENTEILPEPFTEIEVKVVSISSTGDGLAIHPSSKQIYVVPFAAPGDVIKAKVIRHFLREHYTLADFVSVVSPGPLRDDTRINCKYFSTCSGCQFQMLDYPTQLGHKRSIVERAYKNFSQLPPELVPAIQDTIGSPLQYGYRTKLTPHFDGPPGYRSRVDKKNGIRKTFQEVPPIGFMAKGKRATLDIEDCPIGTDAVRMGMKRERVRVAEELEKYKKGATVLLRESTSRVPNDDPKATESPPDTVKVQTATHTDFKTCITDNNATSTEYIDDFSFSNPAGAFFQNNNSILPVFTQYIRDHILPPPNPSAPAIKYLIDAYSGSGLFTITLSSLFTSSTGIDIAASSITSARENAALNNLPPSQCTFIAADAPELFKSVTYPNDETVVVIDPPRKGCDESFLKQLLGFAPRRVVYVSCNVHTQARDVGVLVRGVEGLGSRYEIESLRGFDFFPQTGHVEGVAVLNRVD